MRSSRYCRQPCRRRRHHFNRKFTFRSTFRARNMFPTLSPFVPSFFFAFFIFAHNFPGFIFVYILRLYAHCTSALQSIFQPVPHDIHTHIYCPAIAYTRSHSHAQTKIPSPLINESKISSSHVLEHGKQESGYVLPAVGITAPHRVPMSIARLQLP